MSIDKPTLGDIFQIVARDHWKGRRGEVTAIRNALCIISKLGGMDIHIESLDYYDLSRVIAEYQIHQRLSNATINRKLAALSRILTKATQIGIKVTLKITFLPEDNKRIRWITEEEQNKMLQFFKENQGDDLSGFFKFMIDTGLRLSEGINLMWKDIDLKQGLITIWNTKNDLPRTVPLTERSKKVLLDHSADTSDYPFHYMTVDKVEKIWSKMRKYMELEDDPLFTPHVMRHTCATRLVNAGADLLVVKEWLGHKSLNTTLRYAHLNPHRLKSAVALLEKPKLSVDGFKHRFSGTSP